MVLKRKMINSGKNLRNALSIFKNSNLKTASKERVCIKGDTSEAKAKLTLWIHRTATECLILTTTTAEVVLNCIISIKVRSLTMVMGATLVIAVNCLTSSKILQLITSGLDIRVIAVATIITIMQQEGVQLSIHHLFQPSLAIVNSYQEPQINFSQISFQDKEGLMTKEILLMMVVEWLLAKVSIKH